MQRDPVCGKRVESNTPYKEFYDGRLYYFCCQDCLDEFFENLELYAESDENLEKLESED